MLYVLLAASALAALICCIILLKTGREDSVRRRPQWQDEDAEEDEYESVEEIHNEETVYLGDDSMDYSTPWRYDSPAPEKQKKSGLLLTLEIVCGIEFIIAIALLITEILRQHI